MRDLAECHAARESFPLHPLAVGRVRRVLSHQRGGSRVSARLVKKAILHPAPPPTPLLGLGITLKPRRPDPAFDLLATDPPKHFIERSPRYSLTANVVLEPSATTRHLLLIAIAYGLILPWVTDG